LESVCKTYVIFNEGKCLKTYSFILDCRAFLYEQTASIISPNFCIYWSSDCLDWPYGSLGVLVF